LATASFWSRKFANMDSRLRGNDEGREPAHKTGTFAALHKF
jgi:hypothetical protein